MKLNLFAFRKEDEKVLLNSFNALKNKSQIELVESEELKQELLQYLLNNMLLEIGQQISFQNLFKLNLNNGIVYISQLLNDRFYPESHKYGIRLNERKYSFSVVGICECDLDLGDSIIRKTTIQKSIFQRFINNDIEVGTNIKLNKNFHIQTNRKQNLEVFLNNDLCDVLNKYQEVILITRSNLILLCFENPINVNQTRVVEMIFEKVKYIKT